VVIAVKLDVIKGGRDAMPAGHSRGFGAAYMSHGSHDYVAEPERFADQNNFKLDGSSDRQLPGAEKIDSRGANVTSDEGDGRFFSHSGSTAKTQGEVQSGAGVFPMFWMDADGMRGYADETPRLSGTQEGC